MLSMQGTGGCFAKHVDQALLPMSWRITRAGHWIQRIFVMAQMTGPAAATRSESPASISCKTFFFFYWWSNSILILWICISSIVSQTEKRKPNLVLGEKYQNRLTECLGAGLSAGRERVGHSISRELGESKCSCFPRYSSLCFNLLQ